MIVFFGFQWDWIRVYDASFMMFMPSKVNAGKDQVVKNLHVDLDGVVSDDRLNTEFPDVK